jgi:ABC-type Fe3+-hydroxamate transport system substrate-binding protein
LPARPRIASVALASDTILLELLGAEHLSAVSWVVDWPEYSPYAGRVPRSLPRLTGNPESVAALRPDLAVTAEFSTPGLTVALRAAGIETFELSSVQSLDAVLSDLEQLGECVGVAPRAHAWANQLRSEVNAVEARAAKRQPIRGLIVDAGSAQGLGTLADELLSRLHVTNPARQTRLLGSVALDAERLMAWRPEVIFVAVSDVSGALDAQAELSHVPGYDLARQSADWVPPRVAGIARRSLGAVSPLAVAALEAMDGILEHLQP